MFSLLLSEVERANVAGSASEVLIGAGMSSGSVQIWRAVLLEDRLVLAVGLAQCWVYDAHVVDFMTLF